MSIKLPTQKQLSRLDLSKTLSVNLGNVDILTDQQSFVPHWPFITMALRRVPRVPNVSVCELKWWWTFSPFFLCFYPYFTQKSSIGMHL